MTPSANPSICPTCGTEIPEGAPSGLCPKCLLVGAGMEYAGSAGVETLIDNEPGSLVAGALAAPESIGPYRLLKPLGEGGMGRVFVAEQRKPIRRQVALKIIKPGMDSREVLNRFEAERQAVALMDHPGIARVFDAGATEDGRPYFVMELVTGTPLTEFCDEKKLSLRERLALFQQICQAVQHAHQKGIIHRDLKPSNILVAVDDGDRPVPKIIDFGVAKALGPGLTEQTLFTVAGQIIGTPQYMSPEQATFDATDIDTRSDIYALGVLLYELLTGRTPLEMGELQKAGLESMLRAIREQDAPRPSTRLDSLADASKTSIASARRIPPSKLTQTLRGDLDWVVMKALEKERDRRYKTANALAEDIRRFLEDETVSARAPSPGYKLRKFARRNKAALAAGVLIAFSLVSGTIISAWQAVRAGRAESLADSRAVLAERAGKLAEQKRSEATTAWSESVTARADSLIERGDPGIALAYLAQALTIDPANQAAARRIVDLLTEENVALPVEVLPEEESFSSPLAWILEPPGPGETQSTLVNGQERIKVPREPARVAYHEETRQLAIIDERHEATVYSSVNGEIVGGPWTVRSPIQTPVLCFSADGSQLWILGLGAGETRFWERGASELSRGYISHRSTVDFLTFRADNHLIAARTRDKKITFWDPKAGVPIGLPLQNASDSAMAFSDSGHYLASGDLKSISKGSSPRWDVREGRALWRTFRHHAMVTSIAFDPLSEFLATADESGSVRLWDLRTGLLSGPVLAHPRRVNMVAFDPTGARILTACDDSSARIWDRTKLDTPPLKFSHEKGRVMAAAFSPDGSRIALTSTCPEPMDRAILQIWDAATARPLSDPGRSSGELLDLCFSPDGSRVATAGYHNGTLIWDARTGRKIQTLYNRTSWQVRFSRDGGQVLAASSGEDCGQVFDLGRNGRCVGSLHHGSGVVGAEWDPAEEAIVTASLDGSARVWDARTMAPLSPPLRHEQQVRHALFGPQGRVVITAGVDLRARLWNSRSGLPVSGWYQLPKRPTDCKLSPDGKLWAVACHDGTVVVRDWITFPEEIPAWLPSLAEAVSGWRLDNNGLTLAVEAPARVLQQVKKDARRDGTSDDLTKWLDWFLADRFARPTSPRATLSVREHVDRLVASNSYAELVAATRIMPNHSAALWKLGIHLDARNPGSGQRHRNRALASSPEVATIAIPSDLVEPRDPTDLERLREQLGRGVLLRGRIVHLGASRDISFRYLNFTDDYRKSVPIVVHVASSPAEFTEENLQRYVGKLVEVSGRLSEHRGQLQVMIGSLKELRIIDESSEETQ